MNVYGSQFWRLNNKSAERFYVAWRKTIRRIWRLDNRTHNALINLINGCLPVNLMLEKRCITLYGTFLIVCTSYTSLLVNRHTPFTMEDLPCRKYSIFDV